MDTQTTTTITTTTTTISGTEHKQKHNNDTINDKYVVNSPLVSTFDVDNTTTTIDIHNDNRQATISTIDIANDSRQPTANDNNDDACKDVMTHDLETNFNTQPSSPSCTVAGKAWRKPGPKEQLVGEGDFTCQRHARTPKVGVLGCSPAAKTRQPVRSCAADAKTNWVTEPVKHSS